MFVNNLHLLFMMIVYMFYGNNSYMLFINSCVYIVCKHVATDLSDGEHSVPTWNHFVPLVVQQVHVTLRLIPADEL